MVKLLIKPLLAIMLINTSIPIHTASSGYATPHQASWFSSSKNFWTWRTASLAIGLSLIGAYGLYRWYTKITPPSFTEWKQACDKLPYFKQNPYNVAHTMIKGFTHDEFERTLDQFSQMMATSSLSDHDAWLKGCAAPQKSFFNLAHNENRNPYVQKYECPQGSTFILHGDLHGDVHSLVTAVADYIEPSQGFRLKPGISMIFLGDYVDKGLYGCECIYTLMRLKLDNPDRVFLLRGNHETRLISSAYGFKLELEQKRFNEHIIDKVFRFYNLLPVALYLGSNNSFVQCCHGGFEVGFNAGPLLNAQEPQQFQWVDEQSCNRQEVANKLNISHCCSSYLQSNPNDENESGFMWSDFIVDKEKETFYFNGRGLNFSHKTTDDLLKLTNNTRGPKKLRGVLRAHQHSPMLDPMMRLILDHDKLDPENKGVAKLWRDNPKKGTRLWHGIVVTFNVSPDTPYGNPGFDWPGYDFDTIGTLKINGPFERWTLDITRKIIG
ncbi:MAG: metallophosphoesterase family protein [Candidatus Babeliales bacterium]